MPNLSPPTLRRRGRATRAGRRSVAVAALVVLACALIAAPGSAARPAAGPAAGGARPASVPACLATGLVAWLDTTGNGAAGTIFFKLHFTNLSGHRCTVRGYPGVSAANLSGRGIGPGASRLTGTALHTITLNNGATAAANLGIVDALNFPPALCGRTTAAGLRVFAPGATRAKFVPFPFGACTHHVSLRISPVARH
jgi:hypothetical protein